MPILKPAMLNVIKLTTLRVKIQVLKILLKLELLKIKTDKFLIVKLWMRINLEK